MSAYTAGYTNALSRAAGMMEFNYDSSMKYFKIDSVAIRLKIEKIVKDNKYRP